MQGASPKEYFRYFEGAATQQMRCYVRALDVLKEVEATADRTMRKRILIGQKLNIIPAIRTSVNALAWLFLFLWHSIISPDVLNYATTTIICLTGGIIKLNKLLTL